MKASQIFFGALGLLLLVTLAGAVYMAEYLDRHKGLLESGLSKVLDREVRIEDGIKLHWSLMPSVALKGLWVGNPKWASGQYLAHAERAVIQFNLMPLLRSHLDVKQLSIYNADIHLETATDGRSNWSFTAGNSAVDLDVDVNALRVKNSRLYYGLSNAAEQRVEISDLGLNTQASEKLELEAKLTYRDLPLSISATSKPLKKGGHIGPLSTLLAGGGQDIDLSVHHNDMKVRIHGAFTNFDQLLHNRFNIQSSAPSLSRLPPWFGVELPESLPFVFAAQIEGNERHLKLTGLKLTLGEREITGKLNLPLIKGERIEGVLDMRRFDLTPYLSSSSQTTGNTEPILERELPPDAFQGFEGTVQLKLGHLQIRALEVEGVSLDAELEQGHLKLKIKDEKELLTTDVDLKPDGTQWQLALHHKAKLELGSLIDAEKNNDERSNISLNTDTELNGTGSSLADLLGSANGQFTMVLGAGRLSEKISRHLPLGDVFYKLVGMVAPASHKEPQAKLECAVVQLDIADGIASSSKGLALRTDKINVLGGGALKLRTGEIELQFKTAQRKGLGVSLQGVAEQFIHLTGTLNAPKVGVNVASAATHGTAAWATGGLSLLADSIFTRLTAFDNPCEHVLEAVEK